MLDLTLTKDIILRQCWVLTVFKSSMSPKTSQSRVWVLIQVRPPNQNINVIERLLFYFYAYFMKTLEFTFAHSYVNVGLLIITKELLYIGLCFCIYSNQLTERFTVKSAADYFEWKLITTHCALSLPFADTVCFIIQSWVMEELLSLGIKSNKTSYLFI